MDEAIKQAALQHTYIMPVSVPEDMPLPETDFAALAEAQNAASVHEITGRKW